MIQRLKAVTGYEVSLYNTTMENGIPSIWALAKGTAEHSVNLICSAGAHLDPIRAAKSAIHELAGMIPMAEGRWKERRLEAEAMLDNSFLVQQMEDHSLLYSLPQAEERLHFLLAEQNPVRTFAEEFHSLPWQEDLTEDLKQILQVFHSFQMDVIVVDQSSSETLRNGLHCVKVLIPGMLPMTFGHHLTRLIGLNRVLDVPMKLGYANHRLTWQELNPYPHPFP
jgi:ribosomal protein S12 methylthiotransferase accessory factor